MPNLNTTFGLKAPKYLVCDGNGDVLAKFATLKSARYYAGKCWFIYKAF